MEQNRVIVQRVKAIADRKGVTPGQLALAWVLSKGDDLVPIPGTKRREYLEENAGAVNVTLTEEDLRRIDEAIPRGSVAGERYSEQMMRTVNR
jgi:aryl-alcohol dehydrogenase-like predicted oxidoreductase